jgi:hypothetical protein
MLVLIDAAAGPAAPRVLDRVVADVRGAIVPALINGSAVVFKTPLERHQQQIGRRQVLDSQQFNLAVDSCTNSFWIRNL